MKCLLHNFLQNAISNARLSTHLEPVLSTNLNFKCCTCKNVPYTATCQEQKKTPFTSGSWRWKITSTVSVSFKEWVGVAIKPFTITLCPSNAFARSFSVKKVRRSCSTCVSKHGTFLRHDEHANTEVRMCESEERRFKFNYLSFKA